MPTTAKLVAAAFFALIGWLAANAYVPALDEGAAVGRFREITALIGLAVGWRTMGSLVGGSYSDAIGAGLRTSVTLVFFALLFFATLLMLKQTEKMAYDGPMEAIMGVVDLMVQHGRLLLRPGVLVILLFGGALGGLLAEWAGRRWR